MLSKWEKCQITMHFEIPFCQFIMKLCLETKITSSAPDVSSAPSVCVAIVDGVIPTPQNLLTWMALL